MFKSIISKTSFQDTEDLCLFKNPVSSLKAAKLIFFSLEYDFKGNSTWEIYVNPTVTSDGTIQTAVKFNSKDNDSNSISLFANPTVSNYNALIRKFLVPSHTQEFSTNAPSAQLEPGESILVRKVTKSSGKVTNTWTWEEVDLN